MVNKIDEICGAVLTNKCDIAVITESWLLSHITDNLISIPDFSTVRKDRASEQRGGGLCTYINKELNFIELDYFSDVQVETQWFLLKPYRLPRNINSIIMVTVYHPPQNNNNILRNHLFQFLDIALTKYPNSGIIILGDFNQFKPGSLCSSSKLKKLVLRPTRGANILDQIYSNLHRNYCESLILPPIGSSDHSSIILKPKAYCPTTQPTTRILRRDCRLANKQALTMELSRTDWSCVQHYTTCNEKLTCFNAILSKAIDSHLPMRSIKLHPSDKPWINTNIKKLIAKRQRAWLTGHPSAYSFYRNKATKLCRQARRTYFNSKILNTKDSNPKKWWKNIKALSGFAKPPLPSCLYHDGEFKRGADLADLIAESFSKVSDDIPALSFTKLPIITIPNEFILSPQQVEYELSNIKVHKSVGPDAIPNWLLKFCASFLSSPICSIFNSSIAQGAFPNTWKCADVIPISKVPNPKSADDDLRPISLTSVLSKILERFIYRWLLSSIHPHIDPYQYGNIKNCSTTHQLIHLIHHWLAETDKPGNLIRSCMIDFSKAFDRIDHNILLMKLTNLDVPPILINWCANFLQDRQLRVKLGEIRSNWKQIKAGVPQGTILGPLFFLVMINDLTTTTTTHPLYKYVDDCSTYEVVSRPACNSILQLDISTICDWSNTNNMRLNAKKTKEFRVSFLQSEPEFDHLTINGSPLEVVDSFKLLGITLSSDLSWNIHVSNISAKASKRLYALRILKRHGVPVKNLISIFCSFIRPVLEYACQVWHSSLPLMLSDQIKHIQKRALKIVFPHHSYAEALDKAKLKTLQERREIQCLSLYQSILKDDNKLNNLLPSPITHKYSLRNPRKYPLFKCRTERFRNSFIPYCVAKWDSLGS